MLKDNKGNRNKLEKEEWKRLASQSGCLIFNKEDIKSGEKTKGLEKSHCVNARGIVASSENSQCNCSKIRRMSVKKRGVWAELIE